MKDVEILKPATVREREHTGQVITKVVDGRYTVQQASEILGLEPSRICELRNAVLAAYDAHRLSGK